MNILSLFFLVFFGGLSSHTTSTAPTPLVTETPALVQTTTKAVDATSTEKLAKCLTTAGAKMYGAYWCPHCADQKKLFGDSFKYISYVECDAKGENPNPAACKKAGIEGYPTWIFSDGNKVTGTQNLDNLSKLSNCQ